MARPVKYHESIDFWLSKDMHDWIQAEVIRRRELDDVWSKFNRSDLMREIIGKHILDLVSG
jgi:hypothetical protein